MPYQNEFQFLTNLFKKYHLQVLIIDPNSPFENFLDFGLRNDLGFGAIYIEQLTTVLKMMKPNTIYQITDQFWCNYFLLEYPEKEFTKILAIGPFLDFVPSRPQLLERGELIGLSPQQIEKFKQYYSMIPVFQNRSTVFVPLETFAECLWGIDNFITKDINLELTEDSSYLSPDNFIKESSDILLSMRVLEARYETENEMMKAVSLGLTHKADTLLSGITPLAFEQRTANPIRDVKGYCIIMNTLLRKSAEQGGVHPIHLDRISTSYAKQIEAITSTTAGHILLVKMFRAYCRLVKKHSTRKYSSPVQKAIIYIESNLSGELSLKILSDMQNINASYFSTLFKKETGQTITNFITQERIQMAIRILSTTNLQIQTVSQYCGFSDVNYFSKTFKKYTGKTPNTYRKDVQENLSY